MGGQVAHTRNAQVLLKHLKRRDHLQDLVVDGRVILRWMLMEQSVNVMKSNHLAHEQIKWQDSVTTTMNPWVPHKTGNLFISSATLRSQEGLCHMALVMF